MPRSASSSPYAPTVLLVEDDESLARALSTAMRGRGFRVEVAPTGREAIERVESWKPDIVVLDLGLPDLDGIDVCRHVRRWFVNPIIVLSADGDEARKIAALDEGADDYVTKPFSSEELFARLRVAVRHRQVTALVSEDAVFTVGDVAVDTGARVVLIGGEATELPRKQFELLAVLVRNAGRICTYNTLMTALWGEPRGDRYESLRWQAFALRRALGTGPKRPKIENDQGVGYRLVAPDAPPGERPGPD